LSKGNLPEFFPHSVPKGPKSGRASLKTRKGRASLKTRKDRASLKTRKDRASFKTREGLVQGKFTGAEEGRKERINYCTQAHVHDHIMYFLIYLF
jgi:hypothetical protein